MVLFFIDVLVLRSRWNCGMDDRCELWVKFNMLKLDCFFYLYKLLFELGELLVLDLELGWFENMIYF